MPSKLSKLDKKNETENNKIRESQFIFIRDINLANIATKAKYWKVSVANPKVKTCHIIFLWRKAITIKWEAIESRITPRSLVIK